MTAKPPNDLIPAVQGASLLHLHVSGVYRWIFSGKLRGWKRGGRYFVSRSDCENLFRPVEPPSGEMEAVTPESDLQSLRDAGMM
jgi:excisionase family DNA binding protein